jgi:hypothetical protein
MTITSAATGGNGGNAGSGGVGNGGNANAMSSATTTVLNGNANATAVGGDAGLGGGIATGGNAVADANGFGVNSAFVNASATGGNGAGGGNGGSALATASASAAFGQAAATATSGKTTNSMVVSVGATAFAQVGSAASSQSYAAVGTAGPSFSSAASFQSSAYGIGAPTDAAALALLAGNTNVHKDFDVGGQSDVLLLGALGGQYSAQAGHSHTYSSALKFDIDTQRLGTTHDLIVGFAGATATGAGFDSLHFRIQKEGINLVDKTWSAGQLADALLFFSDISVDFGSIVGGVSGDGILDLDFLFDLTASQVGQGFFTSMIAGDTFAGAGETTAGTVPEPGTIALFAIGVAAMARWRRQPRTA